MLKINSLGSSSTGNCFIVSDGITTIMFDTGLATKDIQSGLFKLNLRLNDIDGVLISHEHQDHIQGIHSVNSCKKYMTKGTYESAKDKFVINKRDIKFIKQEEQFEIKTFKIKAFKTKHDAKEPVCFIVSNASNERMIYLTDTGIANIEFKNANVYIIEANHFEKVLEKKYNDGYIPEKAYERIRDNHLSVDKATEYLKRNVGDETKHIILMHLSSGNDNPIGIMNFVRANLNSENVSFIHPKKHKITRSWEVGYKPKRKRGF